MRALILLAGSIFSLSAAAVDCSPNNLVLTKNGYYGAVSPELFEQLQSALKSDGRQQLQSLLNSGGIFALPKDEPACVLNVNFHGYRKQITYERAKVPLWVADDALLKVN